MLIPIEYLNFAKDIKGLAGVLHEIVNTTSNEGSTLTDTDKAIAKITTRIADKIDQIAKKYRV